MSIEATWVSVKCRFKSILVVVCYPPPNASSSFVTFLHEKLSILFTQHPGQFVFLVGDFNFRELNRNLSHLAGSGSSGECPDLISLCLDFNLSQIIYFPTRATNRCLNKLHLLLTNHPKSITSLTGFEGISDHKAVFYNLGFQAQEPVRLSKEIRLYNKENYEQLNQDFSSYFLVFLESFDDRNMN